MAVTPPSSSIVDEGVVIDSLVDVVELSSRVELVLSLMVVDVVESLTVDERNHSPRCSMSAVPFSWSISRCRRSPIEPGGKRIAALFAKPACQRDPADEKDHRDDPPMIAVLLFRILGPPKARGGLECDNRVIPIQEAIKESLRPLAGEDVGGPDRPGKLTETPTEMSEVPSSCRPDARTVGRCSRQA